MPFHARHHVIAFPRDSRESSLRSSARKTRLGRQWASAIVARRLHLVYPPKLLLRRLLHHGRGIAKAEWRERLFIAKYPHNRSSSRPRRRRRDTGYLLSALSQAFPRFRSALLPYRSAMLGGVGEQNKVNVFSFSFFLSLSPPLSLFPVPFSL